MIRGHLANPAPGSAILQGSPLVRESRERVWSQTYHAHCGLTVKLVRALWAGFFELVRPIANSNCTLEISRAWDALSEPDHSTDAPMFRVRAAQLCAAE